MNSTAKLYAQVLGAVLTLVGILGFIAPFVMDQKLLGIFMVDPIHNVIHLLSGVVGLAAGFSGNLGTARLYAGIFGAVYLIVTIVGFAQGSTVLGLIAVNAADNFLHVAISLSALAVYFMSGSNQTTTARV